MENFNTDAFNKAWGNPMDDCPDAQDGLNRVHLIWEETVNALVDSCIKHRFLIGKGDLELFIDNTVDVFDGIAIDDIRTLKNKGWSAEALPDNRKQIADKAYDRLLEAFRPKPVNLAPLFDSLRPCPTNPQTYADIAAQNIQASKAEGL